MHRLDNINEALDRGFLFCAVNSDTMYLRNEVNRHSTTSRAGSPGSRARKLTSKL